MVNKVRIVLLLIVCNCLLANTTAGAQCSPKNKNHLTNASFERGNNSWQISGDDYAVEVMDPGTDDSNGYLSITGGDVVWIQDVRVPTNSFSVCVGGLVKNTISSPKSGWAVLEYTVLDASGKALKTQQMPHLKPGTHWQKLRKTEQLPAAAANIQIKLTAKDRGSVSTENQARFDNLFVRFGS